MTRMLLVSERTIADAARHTYIGELHERHVKASQAGANFWVFEQHDVAGRFMEFLESNSLDALNAAVTAPTIATSTAPAGTPSTPATLWREVTGA